MPVLPFDVVVQVLHRWNYAQPDDGHASTPFGKDTAWIRQLLVCSAVSRSWAAAAAIAADVQGLQLTLTSTLRPTQHLSPQLCALLVSLEAVRLEKPQLGPGDAAALSAFLNRMRAAIAVVHSPHALSGPLTELLRQCTCLCHITCSGGFVPRKTLAAEVKVCVRPAATESGSGMLVTRDVGLIRRLVRYQPVSLELDLGVKADVFRSSRIMLFNIELASLIGRLRDSLRLLILRLSLSFHMGPPGLDSDEARDMHTRLFQPLSPLLFRGRLELHLHFDQSTMLHRQHTWAALAELHPGDGTSGWSFGLLSVSGCPTVLSAAEWSLLSAGRHSSLHFCDRGEAQQGADE